MMKNIKNTNRLQKISLLGNPQSTNHIYKRHGNIIYLSKEGKNLKESYSWQIKNQYKGQPLIGSVKLTVELYFGDKRIRDIDNYNKLLLDACSSLLYIDDKQIHELTIRKNYDKENPRIDIVLEEYKQLST